MGDLSQTCDRLPASLRTEFNLKPFASVTGSTVGIAERSLHLNGYRTQLLFGYDQVKNAERYRQRAWQSSLAFLAERKLQIYPSVKRPYLKFQKPPSHLTQ